MKEYSKLFSLVLTVLMIMSLAMPIFAEASYTITVSNATIGHTYEAYKVFDATYSADGSAVSYIYDGTLAENSFFVQDTNGYVTVKDAAKDESGNLISEAIAFLAGLAGIGNDPAPTPAASETAKGDTVVLNLTEPGYYYVTSTLGTAVTVDTAKPNAIIIDKNQEPTWGNSGNGKVIVDDEPHCRYESDELICSLEEGDEHAHSEECYHTHAETCYVTTENYVSYGEDITFDIAVLATNYDGDEQVTHYCITDTADIQFIEFGMSTDKTPAVVPVVTVNGEVLTAGTDYTLTMKKYRNIYGTETKTYNGFDIDIKWADVTTDENGVVTGIESLYPANSEIHVRYTAKIRDNGWNGNITTGTLKMGEYGNKNTANFAPITDKTGDDPNTTPTYNPDNKKETVSRSYAIGLKKQFVGGEYHNQSGATFRLTTDPYADDPEFMTLISSRYAVTDSRYNSKDGEFWYLPNYDYNDPAYADDKDYATADLPTPNSGVFTVCGLKPGTYYLVEVDTRDGYNICAEPIKFEIEENAEDIEKTKFNDVTGEYGGENAEQYWSPFVAAANFVVNEPGTELPSTGGIGTTLFITFGMIAMLGAGVFLVTNKRMAKESF